MSAVMKTPHRNPPEPSGRETASPARGRWTSIAQSVRNLLREDDGTTAVEYAVMVAMIAVTCMVGVALMTQAAEESFMSSAEAIGNA
ncbi:MAG: Flp family type IVb pilin [Rhodopirellula sp. JB044]|uniref:Flp family type IVb pilin n=1 Tax=Rhodopirellula sp. JB044 TaxID=3342844 RepID=UPI00370A20EC